MAIPYKPYPPPGAESKYVLAGFWARQVRFLMGALKYLNRHLIIVGDGDESRKESNHKVTALVVQ